MSQLAMVVTFDGKDVCAMSRDELVEVARWSAQRIFDLEASNRRRLEASVDRFHSSPYMMSSLGN